MNTRTQARHTRSSHSLFKCMEGIMDDIVAEQVMKTEMMVRELRNEVTSYGLPSRGVTDLATLANLQRLRKAIIELEYAARQHLSDERLLARVEHYAEKPGE